MTIAIPESRIHLPAGVGRDIVFAPRAKPKVTRYQPALTAAAARITSRNGQDFRRLIQPWQARALSYYRLIGEVWYSAQFYSRALSKTRLFPALLDENNDAEETDDPLLLELWNRVQGPGGGQAHLQAQYGRLMFLTGEGYLTASPDELWGEVWEFLSSDELRVQPGGYFVRYTAPQLDAVTLVDAPDDAFEVIDGQDGPDAIIPYRIWRPDPGYSAWADSPMRAVLEICKEIMTLTLAVEARATSRAANSGLLLWPEQSSNPQLDTSGDEDGTNDPFFDELAESFMAPIANPGSASAGPPMLVRMDKNLIRESEGGPRLLQLIDPKDNYGETGLRNECIRRFALGVDMPPEQLLGMTDANHWCADDRTEILTATGWRRHDALEEGVDVMTLNHKTGLSEWKPIENVARFEVRDLEMRSIETRYHSSLTTMNHRWPVLKLTGREQRWERSWSYSDDLCTTDRLITAARCADIPERPVYPDALVELVAWMWTEGSIVTREGRKNPKVAIYQSHEKNLENVLRIRSALTVLHGAGVVAPIRSSRRGALDPEARWREIQTTRGMTMFSLNIAAAAPIIEHCPGKSVTAEFVRDLTAAQLDLFIDASTRADGYYQASGHATVFQKDPHRLEGFELACILAGRSTISRGRAGFGFKPRTLHELSASTRQTFRLKKQHIGTGRYTGVVWCPTTANGSWLARRNGKVFYTGNSGWLVDEQTYKAHLMPVTQQMCDDFNSAYLLPAARDAGFSDWKRVRVGYDATEVINHPDRTKDAKDLWDRGAISLESLREASGFSESDAPPEPDRAERIGIATRDSSLAWWGIPQVRGTGIEPAPGELETISGTTTALPGPTSGAEVDTGPPAESQETTREPRLASAAPVVVSVHRILGQADMAVERCRELAGQRLVTRIRNAQCEPCLERINGSEPTLVAAVLGQQAADDLGCPAAADLVAGGTRSFVASILRLGVEAAAASHLAEIVEHHAARTLRDADPAPLPASFQSMLQRLTVAA